MRERRERERGEREGERERERGSELMSCVGGTCGQSLLRVRRETVQQRLHTIQAHPQ
ncbi:unnamed protein product [Spirodela intermedia]|uniref:Uncharacterized protein n=1 Tax=Spirodela intermedia TaxID=51605 RepID=A0A7I8IUB7_SPIIN|nr:unnamed protein product [Spirodela intermedia]CAA6661467.1 unnamed protein product [Spirodela intermedia]